MKIVTSVVNNPIFIEIQYYTLKKYFKGEFEFIVDVRTDFFKLNFILLVIYLKLLKPLMFF